MPRAGPLRQILQTCRVAELRRLRAELSPQVAEYDGNKSAFEDRVWHSLNRSIDDNETSIREIVNIIRDEIENRDTRRATTRIRDGIRGMVVTPNAGDKDSKSVREKWISSEIYQVLRYEFSEQPYGIEQEYQVGRGSAVDLLVSHDHDDRNYMIEIKLAGSYGSRERLLSQLRRYRKRVSYLRRSFVVLVVERDRDLPANKSSVAHVVEEARAEPDTEVLIKGPEDLLY